MANQAESVEARLAEGRCPQCGLSILLVDTGKPLFPGKVKGQHFMCGCLTEGCWGSGVVTRQVDAQGREIYVPYLSDSKKGIKK